MLESILLFDFTSNFVKSRIFIFFFHLVLTVSKSQQLLTGCWLIFYISAFHSRVNRPHMFLKTNLMKLWIISIFSIFSWFWKILIFMEKFKLIQNHNQISQKDGWHEFRKPRHCIFWWKRFGQHLITSSVHIFVLKFPWDCQKWNFFDISFDFLVNRSQQNNVDQIFCCWKVWYLSFLNPCRTLFHHSYKGGFKKDVLIFFRDFDPPRVDHVSLQVLFCDENSKFLGGKILTWL